MARVLKLKDTSVLKCLLNKCGFRGNSILFDDFIAFLECGIITTGSSLKNKEVVKKRKTIASSIKSEPFVYKEVWNALGFSSLSSCREIVVRTDLPKMPNKSRKNINVWKKHETTIQQKIIKYYTYNAAGTLEKLEEREKKQDDVVHMECNDTKQFAHHELSQYEKTETYNGEVISIQRGTEEGVHLKSLNDEYEYFDGYIPGNGNADTSMSDTSYT